MPNGLSEVKCSQSAKLTTRRVAPCCFHSLFLGREITEDVMVEWFVYRFRYLVWSTSSLSKVFRGFFQSLQIIDEIVEEAILTSTPFPILA
jgi:hypothetical protein